MQRGKSHAETLTAAASAFLVIARCDALGLSPSLKESPLVPRLTLAKYLSSPARGTPAIVRDIARPDEIESLADELMRVLGGEEVQMQRKAKREDGASRPTTEIYDVELGDSIDYMMDSVHGDSYFAFCEGLLPNDAVPGSSELSERLDEIREAPFSGEENWFDYFPFGARPTDAVVLAGAGATSTLHRDPFEWTGTSLCLEGTKVWRFVQPPPGGVAVADEALRSYRLDSIAWEDGTRDDGTRVPRALSAGWQSDMTLYESIDDDFPSAFEWATTEEADEEGFWSEMEDAATDPSRLRPGAEALAALSGMRTAGGSGGGSSASPLYITAIQRPGDLLLIPAHCWHQTYAPVPSVAVASQRCGARADGANVVGHVLDVAGCDGIELPNVLKRDVYEEGSGEEVVARLLDRVMKHSMSVS